MCLGSNGSSPSSPAVDDGPLRRCRSETFSFTEEFGSCRRKGSSLAKPLLSVELRPYQSRSGLPHQARFFSRPRTPPWGFGAIRLVPPKLLSDPS